MEQATNSQSSPEPSRNADWLTSLQVGLATALQHQATILRRFESDAGVSVAASVSNSVASFEARSRANALTDSKTSSPAPNNRLSAAQPSETRRAIGSSSAQNSPTELDRSGNEGKEDVLLDPDFKLTLNPKG